MDSPAFDLAFEPAYGQAVPVVSGVERITANNPGPFTFFGTNSYIVGSSSV
ncbi:MAG: MBL fold metallo-hydrolase, partial [Rhizobium ruizarguesonis]